MARGIGFAQGVLTRDGAPLFWLSARYPYWRDDAAAWEPRLRQLKALGLTAVAVEVPWRHHEVAGELDFDGHTQPNRNLIGFLELIQATGLLAVIKPGPFVGAGADFGGLPDDAVAGASFEPMRDLAGAPRQVDGRDLPAPLGSAFAARALAWLQACLESVVFPFCYPDGPIIALQVWDGEGELAAPDYSDVGLTAYRRRLGPAARAPESFVPPVSPREVLPYLWWSRHLSGYLGEIYRKYGLPLQEAGLPIFVRHTGAGPAGLDDWLTRVNPERWRQVHYGFSLTGPGGGGDPAGFARDLLAVRRAPGPNLAADWGPAAAFFNTVLAVAAGATGCNLDGLLEPADGAGPSGALPSGAETARLLAAYLDRYGGEILTARREQPVSWALYPPYAGFAAWSDQPEDWADLGVKPPRCGAHALEQFAQTMRQESRDFGIVNVEEVGRLDPARYPALTLCGGFLMDVATQQNLLNYVRRGGTLILAHEWPVLNDQLEICTILRDGLEAKPGAGRVIFLEENPFETGPSPAFLRLLDELGYPATLPTDSPQTQAWGLQASVGVTHYFVLSLGEEAGVRQVGPVSVRLPGRSAAMLRVADGRLTAALVKGLGESEAVAPMAACGGVMVAADGACDLLWLAEENLRVEVRP